ncbi:MAG TPA: alpha/beta hydrolase [Steroidobacteraceae bacterium]|jgi:pimeloyl-ACP methyl ester carboxylesterase|nr:alpha/beta hydrolase [Steroidobacteraceae bacterium]
MQVPIQSGGAALKLEAEEFGAAEKGTILLIMGLGTQLIAWPMDFCRRLAVAGYRVIRYDNRDVGLSSKIDSAGVPDARSAILRGLLHLPVKAPYRLEDMAQDAVALMDALKIERAHIVGASLGGMIGQILASKHAARVATLTLIMSSPGAPPPWDSTSQARKVLMARPPPNATNEDLIRMRMNTYRVISGPGQSMAEETLREMARLSVERSSDSAGSRRQLVAAMATGSLKANLRGIHVPTLIIHGRNDPLIPFRRSEQMHAGIAGSKLLLLEGMGHSFPQRLIPQIAAAIIENCALAL